MKIKKTITSMALACAFLLPASSTLAYTSKPGDNMWTIAVNHNMTLNQLIGMNPQIDNPTLIQVGENININSTTTTTTTKPSKATISSGDRTLLAQLVHAEANGEPFEGKVKVAKVVLNRVSNPSFPDTIKDVILQPRQFTPVETGSIHNTPTDSDYQAVDKAVATMNDHDGSLYFYNPNIAKSTWLSSKPTTAVIGHHVFKK